MNHKNGPIQAWWENVESRLFYDSTKETDGFFNKVWLFLRQTFAVIIDAVSGTKIISHSASMTYFTIVVSIPFVSIILLSSNHWIKLDEQLKRIVDYALDEEGIYERIAQSAQSSILFEQQKYEKAIDRFHEEGHQNGKNEQDKHGGVIAIVIIMTIVCLRSFFIGLQRELNETWGCNDRTFPQGDLFGIAMAVAIIIGIALWGCLLLKSPNSRVCSDLFSALVVGLLLWGGLYFVPNSRKVGLWPSFAAAFICSFSLVFLWSVIPCLALRPDGYNSSLGVLFSVLFVVFCSWFIFFIAAELCSVWDRSNDKYLKGSIEQLSPFYQEILTIYTASYIFRAFSYSHKRVTMDQIRRGMFRKNEVRNSERYDRHICERLMFKSKYRNVYKIKDGKFICVFNDEFGEKRMIRTSTLEAAEDIAASCKATGKGYLPISIMNSILDKLVRQNIIDYEDAISCGKRFRYYFPKGNNDCDFSTVPRMNPCTVTVGDILFQLRMGGKHSLKYNYTSNGVQLIGNIREAEVAFLKNENLQLPLKDLIITCDLEKFSDKDSISVEDTLDKNSISAEGSLWLLYKGNIDIKELRFYIEQAVKGIGKEQYINMLKDTDENDQILNGYPKAIVMEMANEFEDPSLNDAGSS